MKNSQFFIPARSLRGTSLTALITLLTMAVTHLLADVPPPRISQFQANPDGSVSLSWDATIECAYRVLTSTNLGDGVWTPVDCLVAASNSVTWQANGQGGSTRFFKLATDSIAIGGVEPSIVSTGRVVTLYIIGQGFGSNDVLRLIGPGGPLTLTNRIIIKPTLMSVTVGPGFTPDLPGSYQFELTSGTSGQKATFSYAWTVVATPAGSASLLEPPGKPPASPNFDLYSGGNLKVVNKGQVTGAITINQAGRIILGNNNGPGFLRGAAADKPKDNGWGSCFNCHPFGLADASSRKSGGITLFDGSNGGSIMPASGRKWEDDVIERVAAGIKIWTPDQLQNVCRADRTASGHAWNNKPRYARTVDCDDNDPQVHPWSGEVQLQTVDMAIPGRGLDFILARTYRSRTATQPGMSYGWTLSYDIHIQPLGGDILLYDGTGRNDVYYADAKGIYSRPEFFNEGRLSNGVFTLTFPDTGKWVFNPVDASASSGKLSEIVDRNGNAMSLLYDSSGRLSQIVDDLGRTNSLAYNASGQLSSVTDFSGRTVIYQYYSAGKPGGSPGDLKSVTSPPVTGTPNGNDFPAGKTTTYTYSSGFANDAENHLLLSVSDGTGQIRHQYVFQHNLSNLEFLRCVSDQHGTNDPTYFTYVPLVASPSNRYATLKVIVRDSVGNVSEPSYDSRNRPVDLREFTGRPPLPGPVTESSNRPVGKLRSDDPDFYETQWAWNNDSLCVKEIEPAGTSVVCVYEANFDKNAVPRLKGNLRVLRELPCCGDLAGDGFPDLVTRFEHDPRFGSPARDYCVQYRESDFDCSELAMGKYGRVKVQIPWDRQGKKSADSSCWVRVSSLITGGRGQDGSNLLLGKSCVDFVTSATDPRGNVTSGAYDSNGNLVAAWQPHKSPGLDLPDLEFTYNPQGQLTAITNVPDANGRRRVDAVTYSTNGPQNGYLSDFTVDTQGPTAIRTSFEHDSRGNVTRCIDPRTNDWLYTYNALDQLMQSSSPALDDGAGGTFRIATQFTYDAADNLVQCDAENRDSTGTLDSTNPQWTTRYTYDRIRRRIQSDRERFGGLYVSTQYQYDGNNNLVLYRSGEAVNGNNTNKVVQFSYDERNFLWHQLEGPFTTVSSTAQYDYDANGRVKAVLNGLEDPTPALTTCRYDGFSRLSSVTDPMGNVVSNRYDANGNIILSRSLGEITDVPGSAGNVLLSQTAWQYDALDRCVQVTDSFFDPSTQHPLGKGSSSSSFSYAPNGQCLSGTDDNGHTTRYVYDTVGRLGTVTDPRTNIVVHTYDPAGNVVVVTQTNMPGLGGPAQVFFTAAQYDPLNRIVQTLDNIGNRTQSAYDSRDNLVSQVDPNGTLTGFSYDGLSRCLATITDLNGDGVLDFAADAGHAWTWDDNDCLLVSTDDNGNATSYSYDALDRLTLETSADGTHHTFVWNSRNALVSSTDPNGTLVSCTYDLLDRCVRKDINLPPGSQVAATTTFETFAYDGCSRLVLASNDFSRVQYTYDSLGDCTLSTQDGLATAGVYDGVGNRLSMTYPGGRAVQYAYDALDQVSSVASSAGLGLPPVTLATYSYDGPGRLSRIVRNNGINTGIARDGLLGVANATGDRGWQQVSRITHAASGTAIIDQRSFAYDRNQNKTLRAQMTEFVQGQGTLTNRWTYNPLNMLDHAINTKGTGTAGITDYDLDAQGNRIAVTNGPVIELYTRDNANPPGDFQMDQYTTTPFGNEQYDDNGNLVQTVACTGQTSYTYDYADRLVAVYDLTSGSATPVAVFSYDALGQRLSKTSYSTDPTTPPVTTYYVYHDLLHRSVEPGSINYVYRDLLHRECEPGGSIIETRADGPGGGVVHTYCLTTDKRAYGAGKYGIELDGLLASFGNTGALEYYFHTDDLGNVLALTDASGNVLERYEYADYGLPSFLTSDGSTLIGSDGLPEHSSPAGNPFLFHGMEWDPETQLYLAGGSGGTPGVECSLEKGWPCRYEGPRLGEYLSRFTMFLDDGTPVRAKMSLRAFAGNNPWTPGGSANVVKGCWIGLDAGSRSAVQNGSAGVFLSKGTSLIIGNVVGAAATMSTGR